MQGEIVRQRSGGTHPDVLRGRAGLAREVAGDVHGAHLDGPLALPVAAHALRQVRDHPGLQLLLARQLLRSGHLRHLILVVEPGLGLVERGTHDEHRPAVLDARHPARREAAAVARPLDAVDDGNLGVAPQQEVGVERMGNPLAVHRANGGHERLAQHLPAEHALPRLLRAAAAKQVILQPLQVQNGEEAVDRARRWRWRRGWRGGFGWRHRSTHGYSASATHVQRSAQGRP